MTKRERERVVELLRCAADSRPRGQIGLNGMFDAAVWHGVPPAMNHRAWDALMAVQPLDSEPRNVVGFIDERYRHELLEAAARVEEGSWP